MWERRSRAEPGMQEKEGHVDKQGACARELRAKLPLPFLCLFHHPPPFPKELSSVAKLSGCSKLVLLAVFPQLAN